MARRLVLVALLGGIFGSPAAACPIASRLVLHNATGQRVEQLAIVEDYGRIPSLPETDQLPPGGLLAGATATVTMPHCVGTYTVTIQLADGTRRSYPAVAPRPYGTLELR